MLQRAVGLTGIRHAFPRPGSLKYVKKLSRIFIQTKDSSRAHNGLGFNCCLSYILFRWSYYTRRLATLCRSLFSGKPCPQMHERMSAEEKCTIVISFSKRCVVNTYLKYVPTAPQAHASTKTRASVVRGPPEPNMRSSNIRRIYRVKWGDTAK